MPHSHHRAKPKLQPKKLTEAQHVSLPPTELVYFSYVSIDSKRKPRTLRTACLRSIWLTTCLFTLTLSAQAQTGTAQFTQGATGTNTMSLQVPLGNYPGRGVNLPINLNYSSKVWRLGFIRSIHYDYAGTNSVAEAIYSEFATAGWTTSLDVPVVEWPKQNDAYWYTGKPYSKGTHQPYTFRVAQVFILCLTGLLTLCERQTRFTRTPARLT